MKLGWTFVIALVFALVPALRAAEHMALDLGDGYAFELLAAGDTPARTGNPKVIFLQVAYDAAKGESDKAKTLEAADRLFESVLMEAAEKGYYKRATVQLRKTSGAGFDSIVYVRGENDVWLRQAGAEPWMTAQDPQAWTPPPSQEVLVQGFGRFRVEAALEIPAPEGFRKAAEIDFVTSTSIIDIQRKYQETKALWARVDRDQMRKDGFDLVLIGNFAVPQRGRFHARKGFFVRIPREANGPWPELPASAPDNRDLLISKNEVPIDQLASLIRSNFAAGLGRTVPEADPGIAVVATEALPVSTETAYSKVVPAARIRPNAMAIKIQ